MIGLTFINKAKQEMNAIVNNYMVLTDIEALHGVDNEFSSSTSPYVDGDVINHIHTSPRVISLTYALRTPITDSISYFNSIVKSKQRARLIETKEDGSEIEIEGIVTVPPYSRWSDQVSVQIQLYCSDPYWKDVQQVVTDISSTINMHYFPFETEEKLLANDGGISFLDDGVVFGEIDTNTTKNIVNAGDVDTGFKVQIVCVGKTATNPTISNVTTNEWLEINTPVPLQAGDYIEISTVRGNKYVKPSPNRPDITIANIVYSGNDWLQLATGDNELRARSKEGGNSVYFSVFYQRRWQ